MTERWEWCNKGGGGEDRIGWKEQMREREGGNKREGYDGWIL